MLKGKSGLMVLKVFAFKLGGESVLGKSINSADVITTL